MLYSAWYHFETTADQSVRRYQPPQLRKWKIIGDEPDDISGDMPKAREYYRAGMNERDLNTFLDQCQLYAESADINPSDRVFVDFTTDGQDSSGLHWYSHATVLPVAEKDKGETQEHARAEAHRLVHRYAPGWCVIDCQRCKRLMAGDERAGWVAGKFDGNNYYQSLLVCQDCWDELKQREASGTLESGVGSLSFLRQLGPTE